MVAILEVIVKRPDPTDYAGGSPSIPGMEDTLEKQVRSMNLELVLVGP